MGTFDTVYSAAAALPVEDRLRLIDALAATVPDDCPPTLSDEWIAELDRRSAAVDNGTATTVPWEIVRKELFKKVGLPCED